MRSKILLALASVAALTATACGGGATPTSGETTDGAGGDVTLEFAQWWEPELPDGFLRGLMDQFEEENPGITVELISGPYASTKEQIVAGAAAKTMSDVVGLDGAWISDFVNQGSLSNLSELMSSNEYDDSQLAAQVQVDGSTWMIPVANFVYPMFVNKDILSNAGVEVPTTRSEFTEAAKAIAADENVAGWALPLDTATPNGIQNDFMSWVWASGGSMLKDGKPALEGNQDVKDVMEFVKDMYDADAISAGAFTMKEQDKVNEFINGRVGMVISSLAHVNLIREESPDLNFEIAAIPSADDYSGKGAMPYASWGIGVASNSEHQDEAFKLVSFLLDKDVNSEVSSAANAFPGNTESVPDFVSGDEAFQKAFEIYQNGTLVNEFTGLPVAEDLMRSFDEELQRFLDGQQSADEALSAAQGRWDQAFS